MTERHILDDVRAGKLTQADLRQREVTETLVAQLVDITLNQDTQRLVDVWAPMVEVYGLDRAELCRLAATRIEAMYGEE